MLLAKSPAADLPPLRHERGKGILLRLAAIVGFSVMAALIKLAFARGASTPEIMFYRSLFGLPPLLLWIGWSRQWGAWRTQRPGAHLARSVIGLVSMTLGFSALGLLRSPKRPPFHSLRRCSPWPCPRRSWASEWGPRAGPRWPWDLSGY
jgi:hypothetical protein